MTKVSRSEVARRTKVIATLGPATDSEVVIKDLIRSGVDAVRLNFSHGTADNHIWRARMVRELTEQANYHVGIIGDLQGPKIRIKKFALEKVSLKDGQQFIIDPGMGDDEGTQECVGLTYPDLYKDISEGDVLLLDDGRIELKVMESSKNGIVTTVYGNHVLSSNKGLNRKGGGLSAPCLTEKDHTDIQLAAEIGIDYLAVSFPKNEHDISQAKQLLRKTGCQAGIIAKIERAEALNHMEDILRVSDAIMVARGDLNLEIGDAALIAVQKRLIQQARNHDKVVITATEMMQSMIENPRPTRAEISDVANAVLDGTDAVMLSGETAIGKHPVAAVETMGRICSGAEQNSAGIINKEIDKKAIKRVDHAVALAAIHTGSSLGVTAIAALTESGSTALWMSRIYSSIDIYALTPHIETCRKVTLYRGVYPGKLQAANKSQTQVNQETVAALMKYKVVKEGDLIIVTKGDLKGKRGGTNTMKVVQVEKA